MQIQDLKVKKKPTRKRVGRGGKRGTYSGRGMNGQKARSGGNVNPLFEGGRSSLVDRLKKTRGFKSIKPEKNNFNLNDLDKNFKDGEIVSVESLLKAKILRKKDMKNGVKILGDGKITKKVTIDKEIKISKSAAEAIAKAGGKVEAEKAKIKK